MTYMDVESGGARWDLYIELNDRAGGMIGRAQYNPDLFTTSRNHSDPGRSPPVAGKSRS